jgi:hypothetical protein
MDTLKKEIERIKSLFTEERLYGNSINEVCDDEEEAKTFLKGKGYSVYNLNKTKEDQKELCKFPSDNLDCVAKILRDNGIKYSQFDHEGKCIITVNDSKGDVKKTYQFMNKNNEYAFRYRNDVPFHQKEIDDTETKKFKVFDARGEFICSGDDIKIEYKIDQYIEEGSNEWEKHRNSKTTTSKISLEKIQK